MSNETLTDLQINTLIGMTDERGYAWHFRAELQGAESNHYNGAIPVGDVKRRLFHWEPVKVPTLAVIPATFDDMSTIDANGNPIKYIEMPGRVAIVRPDTNDILGTFRDSYEIHSYSEWLIGGLSNLLGDSLAITSAGLLRKGAQAWVEISSPKTMHDERTGYDYRPNILAATSLDGSLSTTFGKTVTATVCDNTMSAALGQMGHQKVKIRHSKYSGLRITEAREALSLVHETQEEFAAQLEELSTTTVTDRQWFAFLDEWAPIPEAKGAARTKAENRRDQVESLYRNDRRVAPWAGTALGVVQVVNTFAHHVAAVRGSSRADRNAERAATGKVDELDRGTFATLQKVLVATA